MKSLAVLLFLAVNLGMGFLVLSVKAGPAPVWKLKPAYPGLSFTQPIQCRPFPGKNKIVVAEKPGRLVMFDDDDLAKETIVLLDIQKQVLVEYQEMGLLGFTFSPNFQTDGFVFVNYTTGPPRKTRISRFTFNPSARCFPVESEKVILEFPQPYINHKGGCLEFGPDGYLYIGVGDGGSAGDPQGHGQNLGSLLAKILRIDVHEDAYAIPADNPLAGNTLGHREEIYAWGLRNPWRFNFDEGTGELWAADLGQGEQEEVDVIVKGGNYGWNLMEGNLPYIRKGRLPNGLKAPVHVYGSEGGHSIIGGFVLRADSLPELAGHYLFTDFFTGKIWTLSPDTGTGALSCQQLLHEPRRRIASIDRDRRGWPLFSDYIEGKVYRLER